MVAFVIFIVLIFLFGLFLTYQIWDNFDFEARIFIGFTLGVILIILQVFLMAIFLELNYLSIFAPVLIDFLILGVVLKSLPTLLKKINQDLQTFRAESHWPMWLLLSSLGAIFLFMLRENMLKVADKGLWVTGTHDPYGDLPYHLNIISSFAYGQNFPPEFTIFPGSKLSYHFLSDFFSAIALYLSNNFQFSLITPGIILFLLFIGTLYLFVYQVFRKRIIAFLTPVIFLFNGGLGFSYLFTESAKSGQGIFATILSTTHSYSYLPVWNIQIPVLIGAVLLAQRALLFGLPASIIIFFLLWQAIGEDSLKSTQKNLILAGILTGFLPFLSTYTLINFAICVPLLFLLFFKNDLSRFFQFCLYFGVPAIVVGLPQILWGWSEIFTAGYRFRFEPGWFDKHNPFFFWITNLGLVLPLIIFAITQKQIIPNKFKIFSAPLLVVLLIFNLVIFQPHAWDNLKLFWYPFIFAAIFTASATAFIFRKNLFLGFLVLILLIFSGVLSTYAHTKEKWGLFSKEEQETAEFIRTHIPKDATFLTAPIHNQFVSALSGRKIFMGWWGYLWDQGLQYKDKELAVKKMYAGNQESLDLLKKNKISYVVIGPVEIKDFGANFNFYNNFPVIYRSTSYIIFKII